MPGKTLQVKKIRFTNPYKRFAMNFYGDSKKLPEREAAFTMVRARSRMRKAPKNPKTRYGQQRTRRTGKRIGSTYYQKGLYSKPGDPPFHHGQAFNLRTILFDRVDGGADIAHVRPRGGHVRAWRVGPKYRHNKFKTSIPIPQLHEYGGNVTFRRKQGKSFKTRTSMILLRKPTLDIDGKMSLRYPKRPYMKPAAEEARNSARAWKGGSIPALTKLGNPQKVKGISARRIY